jgi:hypothetical protein
MSPTAGISRGRRAAACGSSTASESCNEPDGGSVSPKRLSCQGGGATSKSAIVEQSVEVSSAPCRVWYSDNCVCRKSISEPFVRLSADGHKRPVLRKGLKLPLEKGTCTGSKCLKWQPRDACLVLALRKLGPEYRSVKAEAIHQAAEVDVVAMVRAVVCEPAADGGEGTAAFQKIASLEAGRPSWIEAHHH